MNVTGFFGFVHGFYWKFMFVSWMLLEIYGIVYGCYWAFIDCFVDVSVFLMDITGHFFDLLFLRMLLEIY